MKKTPLSVIVITLNEERNVGDCLRSVAWADDIVVVDANSGDRTVEIAREFTERIFVRTWEGYAAAKTFAVEQTMHDWVLWLDADERVPDELRDEIRALLETHPVPCRAYEVARRAFFLGKWIRHCGWYPGYVVRLFDKQSVKFSASRVHEKIVYGGATGRLKNDLLHYTDDSLFHYFAKFNRYTSLAAIELSEKGRRASLYDMLVHPPFLFVKMYFLRRGFLDGKHGFVLSLLSAAYVFTKYAKLWEAQHVKNTVR